MASDDELNKIITDFKKQLSESENKLDRLYCANVLDLIIAKLENRVESKFRLEAIKILEYLKMKK